MDRYEKTKMFFEKILGDEKGENTVVLLYVFLLAMSLGLILPTLPFFLRMMNGSWKFSDKK